MVLDPAGENLHDIFLDPLELNSVETEVTAAESPWQAGITEASCRAFKMIFKKMLDSTQPKDKRKYEECIDAIASARNVLLRTHGVISPYQHVFGQDPELFLDVLVPRADVAAVTMSVLDRPSELATQIRQAARQAFVESQQNRVFGGGSVSEIKLRSGERARVVACEMDMAWPSNGAVAVSVIKECVGCVQTSVAQSVAATVADGPLSPGG